MEQRRPEDTYVVLSPPRASSTAFTRVLWNNPMIAHYVHEPFEDAYFRSVSARRPWRELAEPIPLHGLGEPKLGDAVLVKEITFQADGRLPELLAATEAPVVFLIRDPRLTIRSRQIVKEKSGQDTLFPLRETGWHSIEEQVAYCADAGRPYLIVDAADFRAAPEPVFGRVHEALGLPFDERHLSWKPMPHLRLSNHRSEAVDHFFTRVLNTTGIEPPTEPIPGLDRFTTESGLRGHVAEALEIYRRLRDDPNRVRCDREHEGIRP